MILDTIFSGIVNAINQKKQEQEAERSRQWQAEENERNRQWQAEQAALDRKENFEYNEKSADAADTRTRALYNDLESPAAMLAQYREAGLSPSLMFSSSGNGGTVAQGAQGNGATGISTGTPPYVSPLEAEQIALMKAQTRKIDAEALNISEGISGIADFASKIAEAKEKLSKAGYNKAAEAVQVAQTYSIRLHTALDAQKGEFDINKARAEAEIAAEKAKQAVFETISAFAQAQVDEATVKDRIAQVRSQVENIKADTLVKYSLKGLNETEQQKVLAEIQKWETELDQTWEELSIKLMNAKTEQERNRIMEEYQDRVAKNLEDRLKQDKEIFEKVNKREWTKLIFSIYDSEMDRFKDTILGVANVVL